MSSGTRPISLRYVCTGSSALPPDSELELVGRLPLPPSRDSRRSSARTLPFDLGVAARDSLRAGGSTTSSSSSSTSTTPSTATRSISVVSTSGVSSTACRASISSSCVSCPFSRPIANAASKSTCDTPGGSATCVMGASVSVDD